MLHSLITTQAAHGRRLDTLMGDMADLRIIQLHHLRSPLCFAQPPGPSDWVCFDNKCSDRSWWIRGSVILFGERFFFFFFGSVVVFVKQYDKAESKRPVVELW